MDMDVNENKKVDHVALGHNLKYIDNVFIAVLHFTINKWKEDESALYDISFLLYVLKNEVN